MVENFPFLFKYLEREQISFDIAEFYFQIQSHPEYPSLLSIVDTLNFFILKNASI